MSSNTQQVPEAPGSRCTNMANIIFIINVPYLAQMFSNLQQVPAGRLREAPGSVVLILSYIYY